MSASPRLTLLIPDLFAQRELVDLRKMPALGRMLARAQRTRNAQLGMEAWLCETFGVERQQDWPVAPLTLTVDGGEPLNDYWLRCDPVHLRADRARVVLMDSGGFGPSHEEARALIGALNENFSEAGFDFRAPRPARWYLRLAAEPDVITQPLPHVMGKDIDRYLPSGNDCLRWHRVLNEIQMLLHAHEVNLAREVRATPVLNSVWLWGGGFAPTVKRRPYEAVWSEDPLAQALALKSGAQCHPVTEGFSAAFTGHRSAHGMLVVLPQLRSAARGLGIDAWHAALTEFERSWFAPVLTALRERRLDALELVVPDEEGCDHYALTGGDLWKFWRRGGS